MTLAISRENTASEYLCHVDGYDPAGNRPKPGIRESRPVWRGDTEQFEKAQEQLRSATKSIGQDAGRGQTLDKPVNVADEKARIARSLDRKSPVKSAKKARIGGIDLARGFALIGMVCVHTIAASQRNGEETWAWMLFSGKSAPLFAMLAGVSLAFMTGGRRPHVGRRLMKSRVSICTRALVLFGIGVALNSLVDLAPEDILPYYGLMFLFSIPFLGMRIRGLLISATAFAFTGPVAMFMMLSYGNIESITNPTFSDIAAEPVASMMTFLIMGTYPSLIWMSYICLGLAIGRMALSELSVQWRLLGAGALLAGASYILGDMFMWWLPTHDMIVEQTDARNVTLMIENYNVYGGGMGALPTDTPLWLVINGPHINTTLSVLYSSGLALFAVGFFSLIAHKVGKYLKPLAMMGTMTLTIYIAHIAVLGVLIRANASSQGRLEWLGLQLLIALVFTLVWMRFFKQGPLERPVSDISKKVAGLIVRDVDESPNALRRNGEDQVYNFRPERNLV